MFYIHHPVHTLLQLEWCNIIIAVLLHPERHLTVIVRQMNHPQSGKMKPLSNMMTVLTKSDEAEAIKIDLTKLTEEEVRAIRTHDSFMYFSIFKPTHYPVGETGNLTSRLDSARSQDHVSSLIVTRQTRISVECDTITALTRMLADDLVEVTGADVTDD